MSRKTLDMISVGRGSSRSLNQTERGRVGEIDVGESFHIIDRPRKISSKVLLGADLIRRYRNIDYEIRSIGKELSAPQLLQRSDMHRLWRRREESIPMQED